MKKLLPLLTLCMGLCCVSCYDDSPILERLETLEKTTISALQASISALEAKDADILKSIAALENSDRATQEEIETLKTLSSEIEKKIVELKEWIEKILEGYYTSEDIDGQLASINEAIKTLTEKVSSLESKLNNLTAEFAIVFDDSEVGILAGSTRSVGYTITGATEKTTVKALGQNGWSAKVTPNGTDKGTITVTAPNPLTEDEIIVLVYDGEYRTIMSSINFVTGVVTPSQTAVELEAEAGTVEIAVTSNLNYKVSIPEDAKGWLSIVETKATKTETITFAYTECVGGIRKAIVTFIDEANNTISNMTLVQQGSAVEVTLTEAGTLLSAIGEDVYRNLKGLTIKGDINGVDFIILKRMNNLKYINLSEANIVDGGTNEYKTRKDRYDSDAFSSHKNLEEVVLPKSIKYVGSHCFSRIPTLRKVTFHEGIEEIGSVSFLECGKLTSIVIPNSVTTIGGSAFGGCYNLTDVKLSENLTTLESGAFSETGLKSITLPESLSIIQNDAFRRCPLESITIPKNVTSIGNGAFWCETLKEIHLKPLPTTLTYISESVFLSYGQGLSTTPIYNNATLYIPKGTKEAYFLTDFGRFTNIIEE